MKKVILVTALFFSCFAASAQFTYKIKADSLLVTNDSCTAELNLENSTKYVPGFLYNKGKGRTEFRRALIKLNDSMYKIGADTLKIVNNGAPASGSPNYIQNQFSNFQSANFKIEGLGQVGSMGVGILPSYPLQVYHPSAINQVVIGGSSSGNAGLAYDITGTTKKFSTVLRNNNRFVFNNALDLGGTDLMTINATTGNVLIGTTTDNESRLQVVTTPSDTAVTIEPNNLGNGVLGRYVGLRIRANLTSEIGFNKMLSLEHVNPAGQQIQNLASSYLLYSKTGWTNAISYANIPAMGGMTIGADSAGTGPSLALKVTNPLSTGTAAWTGYFAGAFPTEGVGAAYFINDAFSSTNTGEFMQKYGVRIHSTGELHNNFINTATNYGLHIEASGSDINYGVYVNSGKNYMADKLGLGTNSPLHQLDVNGTVRLQKAVYYNVNTSITNASYAITDTDNYLELPEITANQTLTLPTASSHTGRRLTIKNKNSSGNQWSFSSAVKDKQDNNLTAVSNDMVYEIISNGSNWIILSIY